MIRVLRMALALFIVHSNKSGTCSSQTVQLLKGQSQTISQEKLQSISIAINVTTFDGILKINMFYIINVVKCQPNILYL